MLTAAFTRGQSSHRNTSKRPTAHDLGVSLWIKMRVLCGFSTFCPSTALDAIVHLLQSPCA